MYGRNGMDQMNQALLRGYIGILLAELLFNLLRLRAPAIACEALLWVLMVFILFRMFSKNLPKPREENQKFMNWFWQIKSNAPPANPRRAPEPRPAGRTGITSTSPASAAPCAVCRWAREKSSSPAPSAGRRSTRKRKKKPGGCSILRASF